MNGKMIGLKDVAGNDFDAYLGATRLGAAAVAHERTFEMFERNL
ncbi:MAG: hypothetical protein QGF09_03300 [Rhodospirillales bacterium]|nr:hypothetical protein [Rhodospirillales bacterium]